MRSKFSIFLFLLFCNQVVIGQRIDRIEPPNWWIGFKTSDFQILLYGKNIGKAEPKIQQKNVKLLDFQSTNPNYLFLNVNLDPRFAAEEIAIKISSNDKDTLLHYPIYKKAKGQDRGYSSKDVIYLLTPDRFANGSFQNDQKPEMTEKCNRQDKNGRHGGDLEGVRQHLDYIADMGFSALWINPILENNMAQWSYHGYAITDFYKVDPRMGTNESYKTFCREAHQKNIKVIMDMVVNHCGSNHWWMSDPPTSNWINHYHQDYVETNHRKTTQPDPYASPSDLDLLEKGWFVPTMPDLNLTDPLLATYMIQNTLWWIEYAGIDGIRMDTYLYPDHNYMAEWSKAIMSEYPDLNISGEVWYEQPPVLAYWQKGKINHDGYKSSLPSLFDFPTEFSLSKALISDEVWNSGWIYLYETLAMDFVYPDADNLVVFADNHDMSRFLAQVGESIDKLKLAMAFVLTTRGIPQIFYGTEVLMTSPVTRDDGLVRSDFPGGWKKDTVNAFTGMGLTPEQKDMQLFLKKLINWRKSASAVQTGRLMHYVPEQGVYVYFRYDEHQKVMILLNKNNSPTAIKLIRFQNMLQGIDIGVEIITGNTISLKKEIILPPLAPMIIECKQP